MKKSTPNYLVLRLKIKNHNNPSFIAEILDKKDFHPLKILFNLFSCIRNIIQSRLTSLNYKFKSILKQNIQTNSLPLQYSKIRPKQGNSSLQDFSYYYYYLFYTHYMQQSDCTTCSMLKDPNISSLFEGKNFFYIPKIQQSFVSIQDIPNYRLLSIYSINSSSQGSIIPDLSSNIIIQHLIQSTQYIYTTSKFNMNIVYISYHKI